MALDINKLLGGVDQGVDQMQAILKSGSPGVQAGVAGIQGSAGAIAESANAVKGAANAHMAAVAAGETSANRLATERTKLEQVMLAEKFEGDTAFAPKLKAAIKASGNEEGMQRIKKYQQTAVKVQESLESNIQKSNASPVSSLFDGTYQALQTDRATQEQLAKGLSLEVATQELADRRINSMLSNEENMRKLMSKRQYQASKEVSAATLLHTKAINRQKVTEADLADLQTVYNIDKDKMSALTTALNAQMTIMNQGINVAQSLLGAQMTKMQLSGMAQTYKKEEDLQAHFQHLSDMATASGKSLPVAVLNNPQLMTPEHQGLFLTLSNESTFGTGKGNPNTYDTFAGLAAYDNDARRKKVAMDQLWYDGTTKSLMDELANPKTTEMRKAEIGELLKKVPKTPATPNDKSIAMDVFAATQTKLEKEDASVAFNGNMFALTSPLATNADGTTTTFKELAATGTINLKNPNLLDSLGVNWTVAGRNPERAVETQFDTVASGLISQGKRNDGFKLTSSTVASVADDLARVYKFQIATAGANPAFPFAPKTLSFKGIDTAAGDMGVFGGYSRMEGSVDITNPQTLQMMLQNRVDRAMKEAALQAQAATEVGGATQGVMDW